jgi:MtN3 and saliva related transmembrane protein
MTKSTKDISIFWTSLYATGLIVWVVYGFMIMSYPLIITVTIETILASSLLFLKLRYG